MLLYTKFGENKALGHIQKRFKHGSVAVPTRLAYEKSINGDRYNYDSDYQKNVTKTYNQLVALGEIAIASCLLNNITNLNDMNFDGFVFGNLLNKSIIMDSVEKLCDYTGLQFESGSFKFEDRDSNIRKLWDYANDYKLFTAIASGSYINETPKVDDIAKSFGIVDVEVCDTSVVLIHGLEDMLTFFYIGLLLDNDKYGIDIKYFYNGVSKLFIENFIKFLTNSSGAITEKCKSVLQDERYSSLQLFLNKLLELKLDCKNPLIDYFKLEEHENVQITGDILNKIMSDVRNCNQPAHEVNLNQYGLTNDDVAYMSEYLLSYIENWDVRKSIVTIRNAFYKGDSENELENLVLKYINENINGIVEDTPTFVQWSHFVPDMEGVKYILSDKFRSIMATYFGHLLTPSNIMRHHLVPVKEYNDFALVSNPFTTDTRRN